MTLWRSATRNTRAYTYVYTRTHGRIVVNRANTDGGTDRTDNSEEERLKCCFYWIVFYLNYNLLYFFKTFYAVVQRIG